MNAGKSTRRFRGFAILLLILILSAGFFFVLTLKQIPGRDPLRALQHDLSFQFAASPKFIVFPVALTRHSTGLAWIDRSAKTKKIIRENNVNLSSPFISEDGERLLFVKHNKYSNFREVVRCTVVGWTCKSLFTINAPVHSPIEMGAGDVLFSATELRKRFNGERRYHSFDMFYFSSATGSVTKLNEFSFHDLDAIQYVKPKVFFSAPTGSESEILAFDFDEKQKKLIVPAGPFRPLVFPKFRPTLSSCSEQCSVMAFLSLGAAGYDLVISKSGAVAEVIKKKGREISRPSIVGQDIVVNELFEKEYVISAYRLGKSNEILDRLPSSPQSLEELDAISLTFEK